MHQFHNADISHSEDYTTKRYQHDYTITLRYLSLYCYLSIQTAIIYNLYLPYLKWYYYMTKSWYYHIICWLEKYTFISLYNIFYILSKALKGKCEFAKNMLIFILFKYPHKIWYTISYLYLLVWYVVSIYNINYIYSLLSSYNIINIYI